MNAPLHKESCLIDGVCLDLKRAETLAFASAITGLTVGVSAFYIFREESFIVPSIYASSASFLVGYLAPKMENTYRSALVGSAMGAACLLVERGSANDCAKYAAITGIVHFAATQILLPQLKDRGLIDLPQ